MTSHQDRTGPTSPFTPSTAWAFAFRDPELDELRKALQDSTSKPRFCVVRRKPTSTIRNGRGIGKSRLLYEFSQMAPSIISSVKVYPFFDLRRQLSDGTTSLEQLLAQAIGQVKQRPSLFEFARFVWHVIARAVIMLLPLFLFWGTVLSVFFTIAAGIAQVTGKTIYDVGSQLDLIANNTLLLLGSLMLVGLFIIASIIGIRYYARSPQIKKLWQDYTPQLRAGAMIDPSDPEAFITAVVAQLDQRHLHLVLIDDLEAVVRSGAASFWRIVDLFRRLEKARIGTMFVITYNSFDPIWIEAGEPIIRYLEKREQGRLHIDLEPLTEVQIDSLVTERYQSGSRTARAILDALLVSEEIAEQLDEEAVETNAKRSLFAERADLLLGFCSFLEDQGILVPSEETGVENGSALDIDVAQLFRAYQARDQRRVDEILATIETGTGSYEKDCLEIIKCMLAFKMDAVLDSALYALVREITVMRRDQFETCIALLTKLNMLAKVPGKPRYQFANPELRPLLHAARWDEWNNNRIYTDTAFKVLLEAKLATRYERIAPQALESNPSREALDILMKEAEYLFEKVGDTHTALRYYDGENGAFAKWTSLLNGTGNVLELLEWPGDKVHSYNPNPARRSASRLAQTSISPIQLPLIIGWLNFILGRLQQAERLWAEIWPVTMARFEPYARQDQGVRALLARESGFIRGHLALLFFLTGRWDRVLELDVPKEHPEYRRVTFLKLLIELYRKRGINTLAPLLTDNLLVESEATIPLDQQISQLFADIASPDGRQSADLAEVYYDWLSMRASHDASVEHIAPLLKRGRQLLVQASRSSVGLIHEGNRLRLQGLELLLQSRAVVAAAKLVSQEEKWIAHQPANRALKELATFMDTWGQHEWDEEPTRQIEALQTTVKEAQAEIARLRDLNADDRAEEFKRINERRIAPLRTGVQNLIYGLLDRAEERCGRANDVYEVTSYVYGRAELLWTLALIHWLRADLTQDEQARREAFQEWLEAQEQSLELRQRLGVVYRIIESQLELSKLFEKNMPLIDQSKAAEQAALTAATPGLKLPASHLGLLYHDTAIKIYNFKHDRDDYSKVRAYAEQAIKYLSDVSAVLDQTIGSTERQYLLFDAQTVLARAYMGLDLTDRAIEICDQLIDQTKAEKSREARLILADAYNVRGQVLERQGRSFDAITAYRQAIKTANLVGGRFIALQALHGIVDIGRNMPITPNWKRDADSLIEMYRSLQEQQWLRDKGQPHHILTARVAETLGDITNVPAKIQFYRDSLSLSTLIQDRDSVARVLAKLMGVAPDADYGLIARSLDTIAPEDQPRDPALYRAKYGYLRQARMAGMNHAPGAIYGVVTILRQAWADINGERAAAGVMYEPDNLDIALMNTLYDALLKTHQLGEAEQVAGDLKILQAVRGAAIFARIAQEMEKQDRDLALIYYQRGAIIGAMAPDNHYVRLCRVQRDLLTRQKVEEQPPTTPPAPEVQGVS